MAKRFIDTDIFKKRFIRGLPASYKLLWLYIMCDCDNAGIWYVDEDEAQLNVDKYADVESKISLKKALELFNYDEKRIIPFDGGKKWFILSFVKFQYGELRSTNPAHKSVIDKLQEVENEGLIEITEGAIKVLDRAFEAPMDMDKDMVKVIDKDIDIDIEKEKEKKIQKKEKKKSYYDCVTMTDSEYEKLVLKYGEDCTRWCIEKLGNYKISRGKKYSSDYRAILNWVIDEYKRINQGGCGYPRETEQDRARREKQQRDFEFAEYLKEQLGGGVP